MRSSIAAVTAGITSSLLRDSISGTRLTIAGIAPGELQPKKTYLYKSVKSVAMNRGICSNIFSEPDCTTVPGIMQYPLRAATKLVLSDLLDQCVDLAFTGSLGDPLHTGKPSMQPSRTPSIVDKAVRSRPKLELERLDKPSMTTPEYWKRFMSDVLVSTASDLVYDVGRKRAAMINSGSNPSTMDVATWAFASAAAGEFVRAKLDNKYTPDYIRAGVRSAIFKTSFAYVYALLMASPSAEKL